MSPGVQDGTEVPGQQSTDHPGPELADYIDRNREDLEALADKEYPVSGLVQALLDRRDRGEI